MRRIKRSTGSAKRPIESDTLTPSETIFALDCFSSPLATVIGRRYAYNPYIDAVLLPEEPHNDDILMYFEFPHRALTTTRLKCFMRLLVSLIHDTLSKLPYIIESKLSIPPTSAQSGNTSHNPIACLVALHNLLGYIYNAVAPIEEIYATEYAISAMKENQLNFMSGISLEQAEQKALLNIFTLFGEEAGELYFRIKSIDQVRLGFDYTFWIPAYAQQALLPTVLPTDFRSCEEYACHIRSAMESPLQRFEELLFALEHLPYIGIRDMSNEVFASYLSQHFPHIALRQHFMCSVTHHNCPISYIWEIDEQQQTALRKSHVHLSEHFPSLKSRGQFFSSISLFVCRDQYESYQTRYQAMRNDALLEQADSLQLHAYMYFSSSSPIIFPNAEPAVKAIFYESMRQQIFTGFGIVCPFLYASCCPRNPCPYWDYMTTLWDATMDSSKNKERWCQPTCPHC